MSIYALVKSFISLRFPYSSKCLGSLTLPLATSLIFFSIFFSGKVIIFIVILFKINVIIINPIKIKTFFNENKLFTSITFPHKSIVVIYTITTNTIFINLMFKFIEPFIKHLP